MYLLYADESGSIDDPNGSFFVLAGISVFERQTHWLDAQISTIAHRFHDAFQGTCELHGSPMHSGRDGWKSAATPQQRAQAVVDIFHLLNQPQTKIKIFASVIEKQQFDDKTDIIPTAFQDLAFAFDSSLRLSYTLRKNPQRGMMLFDKSTSERMIQDLSYLYKHIGTHDDKLRNFAEVPVFVDSKVSRLIQLADLVAYWIYRYYQSDDKRGFDLLRPHFARHGGEVFGLREHISAACRSRLASAHDHQYPFPPPSI